jgi:KipI family sensor histidine kinase inhibitor
MEWRAYGPEAALIRFGGGVERTRAISAALERLCPPCHAEERSISNSHPGVGGREQCESEIFRFAQDDNVGGVREFTVAFDQVLVEFHAGIDVARAADELTDWFGSLPPVAAEEAHVHRMVVSYDGEDLSAVAKRAGLSEAEVVRIHCGTVYDVAMLGFSPGFPYLTGLDARLVTPRRSEPRARIRAGAVAIGGAHTGIYSIPSPGGWNVIGHTAEQLFDPENEGFLLKTGDRVEFVPSET